MTSKNAHSGSSAVQGNAVIVDPMKVRGRNTNIPTDKAKLSPQENLIGGDVCRTNFGSICRVYNRLVPLQNS